MKRCKETMLCLLDSAMTEDGKSDQTKTKYRRVVREYLKYACAECGNSRSESSKSGSNCFTPETMQAYRSEMKNRYSVVSANSQIAAINYFFRVSGHANLKMRYFRVQHAMFRATEKDLSKEEYFSLLNAAREEGNQRLYMIMQTIASTGVRVSELPFITVESIETRRVLVTLKGKTRIVLMPEKLCRKLRSYAEQEHIRSGSLFVTRTGRPMDRSNIAHEMKRLCNTAGIGREKVYLHNLRHLFAVTYYRKKGDLLHLADLLGHASVNTTRIYTSMGIQEYERQIEDLELVN